MMLFGTQSSEVAARIGPMLGALLIVTLTSSLLGEENKRVTHVDSAPRVEKLRQNLQPLPQVEELYSRPRSNFNLESLQSQPRSISRTHSVSQGTLASDAVSMPRLARPIDALKSRLDKLESRLLVQIIQHRPAALQSLASAPITSSSSSAVTSSPVSSADTKVSADTNVTNLRKSGFMQLSGHRRGFRS